MDSIYWLINAYELDSNYNHSVDFKSQDSQLNWFRSKTIYVLDDSMYQRKNELQIVLYKSLHQLRNCNYLVVLNDDNTKYFYFIMDKIYNDEGTTTVTLKLDLLQTYLFDLNFADSLIEREHTKRWVNTSWGKMPYNEIIEEGLEVGEYEIKNIYNIYDYSDKGTYIFTSSDMLGVSDDKRPSNNVDSGGTSSQNFINGYLDEKGLIFLKSKEGFVSTAYQDINGYWTIGYGITQAFQPSYYNKLYPTCTEQMASEVMGEVVYNFSSQVKNALETNGVDSSWLNQNKLNALTSYAYQNGVGGLQSSSIFIAICEGRSDDEIFNIWYNISEYATRRQEEANIFKGVYPSEMKITDHNNSTYVTENEGKGYIPLNYR